MKRPIAIISIVCLMLVLVSCGCTEEENGGNGTGPSGQTVTMTAEELFNDMEMDTDWETYITMGFTSLDEGDTLVVQDNISNITYNPEIDGTEIIFEYPGQGGGSSSTKFLIESDITDSFSLDDEVKIAMTIKHVTFTYNGTAYDMEVFEEAWESDEYYTSHPETNGLKPMPQSVVEKV